MVSGDQTACAQVEELLGDVEKAVVKLAAGRFAAQCLAPEVTQEMIYMSAARAVTRLADGDAPDPFVVDAPIRVTVEFFTSDMADRASLVPGSIREATRLSVTGHDMVAIYRGFRAMVTLAASG